MSHLRLLRPGDDRPGVCPGPCGAVLAQRPCFCHLGAATIALVREMRRREWAWDSAAYNYWGRRADPDWEDVPF